jgi:hypothetical protein
MIESSWRTSKKLKLTLNHRLQDELKTILYWIKKSNSSFKPRETLLKTMSSKKVVAQTLCKVYKSRVLWQAETLYYVQKRSLMISLIQVWYIKVLWASQAYRELKLFKMDPIHREIISPSSFLNLRMKIWSLLLNSWYVRTLTWKPLSLGNITRWCQDQIWQTLGCAWLVIGTQGY